MPVSATDYTGSSQFVHLHLHTLYSSLDGVGSPAQYVDECIKRGYPAIAATEHGHMGSVPDMYLECKRGKIKYIAGCEIYYNDWEPLRQDLEQQSVKYRSKDWRAANPEAAYRIIRNRHLTVLCKNETGFHNLVKLTTQAYSTGMFGMGKKQFNRIWFEKLCEYKEGLIILSGCLNGPVAHALRFDKLTDKEGNVTLERDKRSRVMEAVKYIKQFKEVFGEDYYIELQMPGVENDEMVFRTLIALADQHNIKIVLANDAHYLTRKDFMLQKIMMAIAQGVTVDSPDLFHVNSDEQYFKTRGELWERFKNHGYSQGVPDSAFEAMCDHTLEIADKCSPLNIDPDAKIPIVNNGDERLRMLVAKRLQERGFDVDKRKFTIDGKQVTYVEQAKIELSRFINKGFSSYFLITRDLIMYGKGKGWPFSPRGCTIPTSSVTTDSGIKPIENVEVGDKVLDGFGDVQTVENKFIYDISEDLITIEFDGGEVSVTSDHKLYIIRDDIVMLLPASDIKDTDEIISINLDQTANHEDCKS